MQKVKQSATSRRTGQRTVTTTAAPILQIGVTSGAGTTFTVTTGVDAVAWDLSAVIEGDVAVTSDGCAGLISAVNDGAETITVTGWYCPGTGWNLNTLVEESVPADGSTITIHRRTHARLLGLKADIANVAAIAIGLHGDAVAADYLLEAGEVLPIVAEPPNKVLDLTQIYAIATSGSQTLHWIVGAKPGVSAGAVAGVVANVQSPLSISGVTLRYDTQHDIRIDGAVGDGVTDDRDAINTAVTNAGRKTLNIPPLTDGSTAVYRISSDLTLSGDTKIEAGAQLSVDAGSTLTIAAPIDIPYAEVFPGAGTVTFTVDSVDYVIPQWWGAVADAMTNDGPALGAAAGNGAVERIRIPPGFYKIATDVNLLAMTVEMPPGSVFDIDGGVTVTINGELEASELDQHFQGDGTLIFNIDSVEYIVPQWWGAVADGVTDDGPAFNAAAGVGAVERIYTPPGFYAIATNVDLIGKLMEMSPGAVLDIGGGNTVTIGGKLVAPPQQIVQGNGTLIIAVDGAEYIFPQWWGAVADGVTDDGPAFNAAAGSGAVESIFTPPGIYQIATNVDLLGKVMKMPPGASLDIGGGITVTIGSGKLEAGLEQHFQGAGAVVFSGDAVEHLLPQWFGAVGDGATDDSAAFNSAAVASAGNTLRVPAAATNYKIEANVTIGATVTMVCQRGALFSIDNGIVVTINGTLEAGLYQIFSGLGTVVLADGAVANNIPQWWGGTALTAFTDGDTTPSVRQDMKFTTGNTTPTTITTFDDGFAGQDIMIKFGDTNTTIQASASIRLQGGIVSPGNDFGPGAAGDILELVYDGVSQWVETNRSLNS